MYNVTLYKEMGALYGSPKNKKDIIECSDILFKNRPKVDSLSIENLYTLLSCKENIPDERISFKFRYPGECLERHEEAGLTAKEDYLALSLAVVAWQSDEKETSFNNNQKEKFVNKLVKAYGKDPSFYPALAFLKDESYWEKVKQRKGIISLEELVIISKLMFFTGMKREDMLSFVEEELTRILSCGNDAFMAENYELFLSLSLDEKRKRKWPKLLKEFYAMRSKDFFHETSYGDCEELLAEGYSGSVLAGLNAVLYCAENKQSYIRHTRMLLDYCYFLPKNCGVLYPEQVSILFCFLFSYEKNYQSVVDGHDVNTVAIFDRLCYILLEKDVSKRQDIFKALFMLSHDKYVSVKSYRSNVDFYSDYLKELDLSKYSDLWEWCLRVDIFYAKKHEEAACGRFPLLKDSDARLFAKRIVRRLAGECRRDASLSLCQMVNHIRTSYLGDFYTFNKQKTAYIIEDACNILYQETGCMLTELEFFDTGHHDDILGFLASDLYRLGFWSDKEPGELFGLLYPNMTLMTLLTNERYAQMFLQADTTHKNYSDFANNLFKEIRDDVSSYDRYRRGFKDSLRILQFKNIKENTAKDVIRKICRLVYETDCAYLQNGAMKTPCATSSDSVYAGFILHILVFAQRPVLDILFGDELKEIALRYLSSSTLTEMVEFCYFLDKEHAIEFPKCSAYVKNAFTLDGSFSQRSASNFTRNARDIIQKLVLLAGMSGEFDKQTQALDRRETEKEHAAIIDAFKTDYSYERVSHAIRDKYEKPNSLCKWSLSDISVVRKIQKAYFDETVSQILAEMEEDFMGAALSKICEEYDAPNERISHCLVTYRKLMSYAIDLYQDCYLSSDKMICYQKALTEVLSQIIGENKEE